MNLNKTQWEKILSIVLAAVLAIAAVSGWVVTPILPPAADTEARLREKISIDARDSAYLYNGADLVVYSDDHTTAKFTVDGATGDTTIAGALAVSVTRSVNLPLFSWIDCTTNAGAAIGFDTTADTLPDFVNSSTDGLGFQIAWDDTGGSLDVGYICNTVQVPANYGSGGALTLRLGMDAVTTNAEFINCQGSINGAALGTVGTTAVTTSTLTSYTCTPTLTSLAAGNSLGLAVYVTATTALDDIVSLYSADFAYTATR